MVPRDDVISLLKASEYVPNVMGRGWGLSTWVVDMDWSGGAGVTTPIKIRLTREMAVRGDDIEVTIFQMQKAAAARYTSDL
jgi:hypothetical protein